MSPKIRALPQEVRAKGTLSSPNLQATHCLLLPPLGSPGVHLQCGKLGGSFLPGLNVKSMRFSSSPEPNLCSDPGSGWANVSAATFNISRSMSCSNAHWVGEGGPGLCAPHLRSSWRREGSIPGPSCHPDRLPAAMRGCSPVTCTPSFPLALTASCELSTFHLPDEKRRLRHWQHLA